jgi:hypothetical protein
MSNTLTASVQKVLETETFKSGFTKRVLVLRTTGDYPQTIPFEFTKDRTALLDNLEEGQMVTVHYDIRGNEYNGKFYCNLTAWKVDTEENGSAVIAEAAREKALNGDMANQFNEEQDSGLPF